MITLAIDTSHHVAVGAARDGAPGPQRIVRDARAHVEQLMPSVTEVCAELGVRPTDVDQLVVGMGPGPYTGLRVGIATAATLAAATGIPLARVCSLDALALLVDSEGEFLVASDARRKELFWGRYLDGVRVGDPEVDRPADLPRTPTYGDVPEEFRDQVEFAGPLELDPALLAARFDELPAAVEEPFYLRAADATVPGRPKPALPRLTVPR
ncbi:tRNA (adenosine(37)-N6)-threonylcarbamoyltransferase complex dimerization subunit type 1 TsaB [uncultured Tessaracoccus sp.]|uniref:tRNA (adenosine(37)-N6)-threonylcarbamoyltransferase complex dimerization subunit type 1 TsaB n=1 Tax=uncultured Tessaracoccus sp. TaxID=905023 RepID=UPI0025F5F677|nr:tRNA (adenosine(37)-N6)-threonylcarbamoyltransferase complex dimerization subunit type 1 TsaB [uncultured Tessaracoccus sp.]